MPVNSRNINQTTNQMKKQIAIFAISILCGLGHAQLAQNQNANSSETKSTAASPFIFEDFSGTSTPAGWVYSRFSRRTDGGINNSPAIRANILGTGANMTASVTTSYVAMGTNPVVSFWYSIKGGTANHPSGNPNTFTYKVEITQDGNTWTTIKDVGPGQGNSGSADFVLSTVDPDALFPFANRTCMVRITFTVVAGSHPGINFIQAGTTPDLMAWIDNVTVGTEPTEPVFQGAATLAAGTLIRNIPNTLTYTFESRGAKPLIVDYISSSQGITITNVPITVDPFESGTITVRIDDPEMTAPYSGQIVLSTNDPNRPTVTIEITATTVQTVFISPFIEENFSGTTTPQGWVYTNFSRQTSGGINNSPALRRLLNGAGTQASGNITTCYVSMGTNPILSFWYRITNWNSTQADVGTYSYMVAITSDFGISWDTILRSGLNTEAPSATEFKKVEVDVEDFANQIVMIRIIFNSLFPADLHAWLDDITVGTPPKNELEALSLTGSTTPTQGLPTIYSVTIRNNGAITQNAATYDVSLMQVGNNTPLRKLLGVEIAQGDTQTLQFSWTPTVAGSAALYAVVNLPNDEFPANNRTSNLNIDVQPSGTVAIDIGTARNPLSSTPIITNWRRSLTQTLYFPTEMGTNGGKINAIVYQTRNTATTPINHRIRVWIGETDRTTFGTTAGTAENWIPFSTLTQVVDSFEISVEQGDHDFIIPLDIPYEYTGRNLVVAVYRFDGDYTIHSFLTTSVPSSGRTLAFSADEPVGVEINFVNLPNPMASMHSFANITLMMNMEGMGSIVGVVSNAGNPLEGVKVQLMNTDLFATTDATGTYVFPYLTPGNYEIEIVEFGYAPQTLPVVVAADASTTQNVNLELWTNFTVSGKVIGSNAPNGLEGVNLKLTGTIEDEVVIFTGTTNATGDFSIANVFDGTTYTITAGLNGYITYTDTIRIAGGNRIRNITLNEIPYPVINPKAEIISDNAVIIWEAPNGITTFRHDAGVITGAHGFNSGTANGILGSVHRENATLTSMSWRLTEHGGAQTTTNVWVLALNAEGRPTPTVLYSALDVPTDVVGWNTHIFTTPVDAPNGFLIGLSRAGTPGFLSLATSSPTVEYPFTNQTHFFSSNYTGGFTAAENNNPPLSLAFMIRAEGFVRENPAEKKQTFAPKININPKPKAYAVYRLLEGETDETKWTQLSNAITDLTFTDSTWTTLPQGIYQYAVKAIYVDDVESPARLTNTLPKDLEVAFTVNITTNSGDPVIGAVVKLTNQNETPAYVYTQTATNSTVVFPAVWKGIYDISVSLQGFEPYVVTNITIDTTGFRNIEMIEIITDIYSLDVNIQGATATIFWTMEPPKPSVATIVLRVGSVWGDGTGYQMLLAPTTAGLYGTLIPAIGTPAPAGTVLGGHTTCAVPATLYDPFQYKIPTNANPACNSANIVLDNNSASIQITPGTYDFVVLNPVPNQRIWIANSDQTLTPPSLGRGTNRVFEGGKKYTFTVGTVADNDRVTLTVEDYVPQSVVQKNSVMAFNGFTVYLNGEKIETGITEQEFTFTNLCNREYTAGVERVYTTGVSIKKTIDFEIIEGEDCGASVVIKNTETFVVFPNPVTDELRMENGEWKMGDLVEIFDMNGKRVLSQRIPLTINHSSLTINISHLPSGAYVVRTVTSTGLVTGSVRIIKH